MNGYLLEYLQNLTDPKSIIGLGFYFLLIVVFAETGLFFGFFLPGDYLLFMAGLLCSTGRFDISIYTLVFSLIGAGILGNYTGYWFGYRTGPALFNKPNSLFFKKQYIEIAEEFYAKHGGKALVLGRFFPIIRTFAPIFAGVVKVDLKKFTLYNFIGSIAWVSTFTLAGYFLGRKYPQLKDYLEYIILGLIVATTIPLIAAFYRRKLQRGANIKELK
ncbi:MAG: DedA family protein [Sphingobacteriales bacterium]